MAKYVSLFTDGSCYPNPGPGGWAVVAYYLDGRKEEFSGSVEKSTNNRMEIIAAIKGLELIEPGHIVLLTTDSQYLKNGITWWLDRWRERNWITSNGSPVKNRDLWEQLIEAEKLHAVVHWKWVRGHGFSVGNVRADKLAAEQRIARRK